MFRVATRFTRSATFSFGSTNALRFPFFQNTRSFHPKLEALHPHLQSKLWAVKVGYDTKFNHHLFEILQQKLYLYYSYEEELDKEISIEDRKRATISKQKLEHLVLPFEQYVKKLIEYKETKFMIDQLTDQEEITMMEDILTDLDESLEGLEKDIISELVAPPISGDSNIILEIRAGAGGAEASLFVKELAQMYENYAGINNWEYENMSISEHETGGYREITASIGCSGGTGGKYGVFGRLQFETGVHRVQRVPDTESAGRLHTSTVTVAILPEAKDCEVDVRPQDIRIDLYRASGPGGQHVNKTDSAVRLTHLPTGIVVAIQDERSQHKNKDKAMRYLKAKIFEREKQKNDNERQSLRQQQIGSGDRSEKIRTYNFPQNRITDHRVNESFFGIEQMMAGMLLSDIADVLHTQLEKQQLEQILHKDVY